MNMKLRPDDNPTEAVGDNGEVLATSCVWGPAPDDVPAAPGWGQVTIGCDGVSYEAVSRLLLIIAAGWFGDEGRFIIMSRFPSTIECERDFDRDQMIYSGWCRFSAQVNPLWRKEDDGVVGFGLLRNGMLRK